MRSGRRRRDGAAALALALLVATVASGCAPGNEPPAVTPSPGGLPAGVTAELQQLRSDVAARQAQVIVRNGTGERLVIGDIELADPRLDGPATRVADRDSVIAPGGTAGIRVQLPPVACTENPDPDAALHPSLTFAYTLDDAEGFAAAPIEDPLGFLPPLHERECRVVLLSEAADVAFTAFEPSDPGAPARLELTVTPTGDGGAGIRSIQTTNLLTFASGPGDTADAYALDVAVAEGDSEPVVVSLPLVPLRCDPHAVQEDKRGTIFDVDVEVGGEPGEIELAASEELRGRILTWVADWCGFGA